MTDNIFNPPTVIFDGQTIITLTLPPSSNLYLNGELRPNTDYKITGTTLEWLNPGGFTLKEGDVLHFI